MYNKSMKKHIKATREEFGKTIIAKIILNLWKDYCGSKEGREARVPKYSPVFNATNFISWLKDKYAKQTH